MSVYAGPNISTSGLVLCLDAANPLSYPGSGTTLTDLTGNSYTGTLCNSPTYSVSNGGILNFNGLNGMITIANTVNALAWTPNGSVGNQNISIEMWVKSSDTGGVYFTKPWNGNGQYNLWIFPSQWYVTRGSDPLLAASINFERNLSNNTWTQIVVWANSTQIGYYINGGQFTGSTSHGLTGGGVPQFGNNVQAGLMTLYPYGQGWAGNTGFSIAGDMAITRYYNRVLSAAEIKQNFNALKGRFGI